jgi:MoaA/NifB/PqqE/SkfB family radical SAM enzyme
MSQPITKLRALRSRSDYLRRHVPVTVPYLTPRKLANLALNEFELRNARAQPRSLPPFIKIEATPLCHLSCAGCVHHSKDYKSTLNPKMQLTTERAERIIGSIERTLVGVSLSYLGEPLLNRALPEIIAAIHRRRICTSFPTNLSVRLRGDAAHDLVRSGLDLMLVSLDGATNESYLRYRTGGNFRLVLENVRKLSEAKRELGAKRPLLIWKMVVFDHNRADVAMVKQRWRSLGFDGYEFVLDNQSSESLELAERTSSHLVAERKACYWAWNSAVVNWNGQVQPCCLPAARDIPLGNAAQTEGGLLDVWRSEPYAQVRGGFARKNYGDTMHPVCRECLGVQDK